MLTQQYIFDNLMFEILGEAELPLQSWRNRLWSVANPREHEHSTKKMASVKCNTVVSLREVPFSRRTNAEKEVSTKGEKAYTRF
jgi:hypothetical protein